MSGTREDILDQMQLLIQTRGYSAVSYQHIADVLGIRKASVHYHFPTKEALGLAVIERYGQKFQDTLNAAAPDTDSWHMLEIYLSPFIDFGSSEDKICLCGALAGEFLALPPGMQSAVTKFFAHQQRWLEQLLTTARKSGEFTFDGTPRSLARFAFSALQGALLVKRTNGNQAQIRDVVKTLKASLKA